MGYTNGLQDILAVGCCLRIQASRDAVGNAVMIVIRRWKELGSLAVVGENERGHNST
jgi:hypothetical protein